MPVLTLLSDYGNRDWYAASLKGAILKAVPELVLVDITHEVAAFDIVQGAFISRNCWQAFPEGSIHLLAVNCRYDLAPRFIVASVSGHFFIAPDNGILGLVLGELEPGQLRILPTLSTNDSSTRQVFAQAVQQLCSSGGFEQVGDPMEDAPERRIGLRPVVHPNLIRGTVLHIDQYENVVLNIDRELMERTGQGRPFSLYFKRNDPIIRLSQHYCSVPAGEPLCLFNAAGLLEIAVSFGKAATLLGLKREDVVELIFEESVAD
ncbi:MAG: S-adenosyl-l-methionine hydroxide adenosyltransferase family protein [Chitinophagales bacterium]